MTDLILAILHHVLVFSLPAILAAEIVLLRGAPPDAGRIIRLARIDMHYGIIAGLVLIVGFARVYHGAKGPDFYLMNPMFWAKIAAFAMVGILSVAPTVRFLRWRRASTADPLFVPPAQEVSGARLLLFGEVFFFVLILIAAAAMARGYGL